MDADAEAPRRLASSTWPSLGERPLLLVPVGSTEQHGPHLPQSTDAVVAEAVAVGLAARLGRHAIVAPVLPVGASGEHAGFPGTVSIGTEVLAAVLVEVGRSAGLWAGTIVFVNGHGGNLDALRAAVDLLREEGRDARWVPCASPGGDAHAGRTETSLLLHLRPEAVRLDLAAAGEIRPIAELLPAVRAGGVRAVSANGVLGDPAGASAAEGRAVLAAMVDGAERRLRSPEAAR
ncbi:mycofactocin biosynthesis peptidyl-dipeptidase MftE [Amnibacterium kyonggiense]